MTLDARADRTALRLKLYEGGFSPLANKSKLCLTREWSTIKVTPDLIRSREWARSKSFMDTGIRCGDVVALDWDIDDPDLLNDLLDAVVATGLVEESPFVRIGRPPRELWVYRTSEKIGKRTTGHFSAPDAPEDESGYAVEILGAGCQFAAYGQRDADTAYQWPVQSLVDAEYMDLPVITKAQVDRYRTGTKAEKSALLDAICQVTRVFRDPDVTHVDGEVNPGSDIETIRTELILADLQTLEKAFPRLEKEARLKKERQPVLTAVREAQVAGLERIRAGRDTAATEAALKALADAAATALCVAGPSEWIRVARRMDIKFAMLVDMDGTVYLTPEMNARIRFEGDPPPKVIIESLSEAGG